jgi:hypothetical protein
MDRGPLALRCRKAPPYPTKRARCRVHCCSIGLQQTRALVGLQPDRQPVNSPKTSLPQADITDRIAPKVNSAVSFWRYEPRPYYADIAAALDLNQRLTYSQYCTAVPWDRRDERPLRRPTFSAASLLARWSSGHLACWSTRHLGCWSTRRLGCWQVCHPTPSERAPLLSQGFRPAR